MRDDRNECGYHPRPVQTGSLVYTRAQLADMLFAKQSTVTINGIVHTVESVTREDGSGRCFLLTVARENQKKVFFVRISD